MRNNARKGIKMNNRSGFCKSLERERKRYLKYYANCVKCDKCDRTVLIRNDEKGFCPSCGRYIFKDKKAEFDYRMKGLI